MKKFLKGFFYLLIFGAGFLTSYMLFGKSADVRGQEKDTDVDEVVDVQREEKVLYAKGYDDYLDFKETDDKNYSFGSLEKLCIEETGKIHSDKIEVETGEEVQFWATIKNSGVKMKHLTHVCFNHSGGVTPVPDGRNGVVTFSCLNGPQGPNIDPGREFAIHGTTKFLSPGSYSVWLSWGQDENNFYKTNNGGTAKIRVY